MSCNFEVKDFIGKPLCHRSVGDSVQIAIDHLIFAEGALWDNIDNCGEVF